MHDATGHLPIADHQMTLKQWSTAHSPLLRYARRYIHEATRHLPIIGDGDTGYGNALNVKRTVRGYAAAGNARAFVRRARRLRGPCCCRWRASVAASGALGTAVSF